MKTKHLVISETTKVVFQKKKTFTIKTVYDAHSSDIGDIQYILRVIGDVNYDI